MVWSIFKYENNYIKTTKEEINGIPCLKFKPKGFEGLLPTVIYYHGWHSSKDFMRFEALVIASNGYQVIVPDALHHGDRDPIDYDNPKNIDKYLWKIILQNVDESKKFIDTVINNHEASPSRIAILGSSMGAISAGGIFIANPKIKCLVGFNGTFAWQEAIERNHLSPSSDENKELIEYYDPMNNLDKINERSIMILHGDIDTSVPIDTQRVFFDELKPLYKEKPENLEFIEAINVNHHITSGMLEKAIIWLKENL